MKFFQECFSRTEDFQLTIDNHSLKEFIVMLETPLKNPNFAICFTEGK
jgi:hypothetical protein